MADPDLSEYGKVAKFNSTLVENMEILSSMDNYYNWIGQLMRKKAGKKVLDIGCANGNLTSIFADKPFVMGVDYDEAYLKQFKERFKGKSNIVSGVLNLEKEGEAKKFQKYKFDTIVTMNTFEHVKNDSQAFKTAYEILEKGGRFIIFVPALMSLYGILDYEGGHFRRYTKQEMANKLKSAGFVIEDISYFNWAGAAGWWWNYVLMKKRIYSKGTFKVYNALVPFFKLSEKIICPPFGLSVFAVAIKI